MFSFSSLIKASLGAFTVLALAHGGALAQEVSAAALGYADRLFVDIGMKSSLDQVVPGMMIELERTITATRPDLRDPLHATLLVIEGDFVKTEDAVLADSAKVLASRMSEQELKETVTFFEGPTGKKFIQVQPAVLQQVEVLAHAWHDKLSVDILARARDEMKQKGYTF